MTHFDVKVIPTPHILISQQILENNLFTLARKAKHHGVFVRPHMKTHKCIEIANMQMQAGACGITVAKVSEAIIFAQNGITDITVAYPLLEDKLHLLLRLAKEHNIMVATIN